MKNVNEMVLAVQVEGTEGMAFVELFNFMEANVISPKSNSFSKQLKGDVSEAISEGFQLLTELIEKWDGTGNFRTLFSRSFTNRILNIINYQNRNIRKHNTSYDISLSETNTTTEGTENYMEVTTNEELHSFDTYDEKEGTHLSDLIEQFATEKPEQYGIILLMEKFTEDTPQAEKTQAYMEYYGATEYTSAIQKKVSRSRSAFKKFLNDAGYEVA